MNTARTATRLALTILAATALLGLLNGCPNDSSPPIGDDDDDNVLFTAADAVDSFFVEEEPIPVDFTVNVTSTVAFDVITPLGTIIASPLQGVALSPGPARAYWAFDSAPTDTVVAFDLAFTSETSSSGDRKVVLLRSLGEVPDSARDWADQHYDLARYREVELAAAQDPNYGASFDGDLAAWLELEPRLRVPYLPRDVFTHVLREPREEGFYWKLAKRPEQFTWGWADQEGVSPTGDYSWNRSSEQLDEFLRLMDPE
jgi:hypothetical protein